MQRSGIRTNRRLARLLVAGVLVGAGALAPAGAARAHGDEGELTVITAEQAGPLEVRVEVGLLYANDQDLVTDATVTVSATGPDGATVAPTPLENEEGAKYGGTLAVPAPGSWTLSFASEEPTAEATTTVEVVAEAPTTAPESTTSSEPATTTTEATETTETTTTTTSPPDSEDESGGSNPALPVVVAVVVVSVAGALIWRARRGAPEDPTS